MTRFSPTPSSEVIQRALSLVTAVNELRVARARSRRLGRVALVRIQRELMAAEDELRKFDRIWFHQFFLREGAPGARKARRARKARAA